MKNYDDIAKRILDRRDEALALRRTMIMRTVKTAGSVCACLVIGVSLYLGINRLTKPQIDPNPPTTSTTTTSTTTSNTATDITSSTTITTAPSTATATETTATGSATTETTTTLTSTSNTQTCTGTTTTTTLTEITTTTTECTTTEGIVEGSSDTSSEIECTTTSNSIPELTTTTETATTMVPADYRYRYVQLTYNGYTYETWDRSLREEDLGTMLEVTSATKKDGSDPLPVEIYEVNGYRVNDAIGVRFVGTDIICLASQVS